MAKPPQAHGAPSDEVLRRVRIPFVRRALLSLPGGEREGFLVDLGLAGVFLETADPLALGLAGEVTFSLPGNEIPVKARCRVAWWHREGTPPRSLPSGAGLEFVEMSQADEARVRSVVLEHCLGAAGARRFTPAWPQGSS
jgi:hypothetical protein